MALPRSHLLHCPRFMHPAPTISARPALLAGLSRCTKQTGHFQQEHGPRTADVHTAARSIILKHVATRHHDGRPKRYFHSTAQPQRDHHFDTLKLVSRLRAEGFSEAQSAAMMRVLSDVISESIQNITRTMVPRDEHAKALYTQKVDFAKLRSELLAADSSESGLTRASHERLANELAKLRSRLRDDISRTQASVRLDLNLEKGRIREEKNVQEMKIKETDARIEQEVANLRERVEGVKFSTLQWLM